MKLKIGLFLVSFGLVVHAGDSQTSSEENYLKRKHAQEIIIFTLGNIEQELKKSPPRPEYLLEQRVRLENAIMDYRTHGGTWLTDDDKKFKARISSASSTMIKIIASSNGPFEKEWRHDICTYPPPGGLSPDGLRTSIAIWRKTILEVGGKDFYKNYSQLQKVDGECMLFSKFNLTAYALLGDSYGVTTTAKLMETICPKVDDKSWNSTCNNWRHIARNPGEFIKMVKSQREWMDANDVEEPKYVGPLNSNGVVGPYFAKLDAWVDNCTERNLEKVRSVQEEVSSAR